MVGVEEVQVCGSEVACAVLPVASDSQTRLDRPLQLPLPLALLIPKKNFKHSSKSKYTRRLDHRGHREDESLLTLLTMASTEALKAKDRVAILFCLQDGDGR